MNLTNTSRALPWHREPWPWLLMLGPAVVVVAAIYTAWLAWSGADGLIADDYYTQGLAINHELARDDAAARMGLSASASVAGDTISVEIKAAASAMTPPPTLKLTLVHPTRGGMDQTIVLARTPAGSYEGHIAAPVPGNWRITIDQPEWRLTGHWQTPFSGRTDLRPGV